MALSVDDVTRQRQTKMTTSLKHTIRVSIRRSTLTRIGRRLVMSHKCPGPSCQVTVTTDKLMCKTHWFMVPKPLRDAVYRAYDHGRGALGDAHIAACHAAIRSIGGTVL